MSTEKRWKNPFHEMDRGTKLIYELSALGFNYRKDDHAWVNKETGAVFADDAMRDIGNLNPLIGKRIIKLFADGARIIEVKVEEMEDGIAHRVRRVE